MASSVTLTPRREASKTLPVDSLRRSWISQKRTCALLSIRPRYAAAILQGEKRFEFRRAIFRKAVDVVVVYITSPTCLVVGEFDVADVITDSVEDLWKRTSRHAGIDKKGFLSYFRGCEVGHAIAI